MRRSFRVLGVLGHVTRLCSLQQLLLEEELVRLQLPLVELEVHLRQQASFPVLLPGPLSLVRCRNRSGCRSRCC